MTDYGVLSLVPPVLAISLALITKDIIISLFVTVFVSSTIIAGWNPALGFTTMIKEHIFGALVDPVNIQGLIMMVMIGGFVALLTKSGGAYAFTEKVTKWVKTREKCETGIWIGGLAVWFTDSGNSLIVGPIFEALAEKLRVSREKFSYILDCTTTPICSLIPIIGWGVYTQGLIDTELAAASITNTTGFEVFVQGIPLNFYSILTLFMAGVMSITSWDYGPMLQAQNRAMKTGQTIREGGEPMRGDNTENLNIDLSKAKISTMVIPLLVLLTVMFAYLTKCGLWTTKVPGTDIRTGIASGFLCGLIVLVYLCVRTGVYSFRECMKIIASGWSNMMFMCVVLTLAWALSGVNNIMGTGDYLVGITSGFLHPGILPFILFIMGAVMSFATGTSWGTMAILFPIGVPVAVNLGVSLPLIASAIISGSVFGDHCSPISDTTILASIGAASDHIDHFRTQMPYAVTCGIVCAGLFLLAGWVHMPIMTVVGGLVLTVVVYFLHKHSKKKHGQVKLSDIQGVM
ncbi:Na+/H+ antiporter NhaC family protein [Guggenheimella bovis]